MKKKIIIGSFCTLILLTILNSVVGAIKSYNYDIENNIDIFEGFGAVFALMIGAFLVFYELDLFYTVYYFLIKPKSAVKSILNILCNSILFTTIIMGALVPKLFNVIGKLFHVEDWLAFLIFLFVYFILRVSYVIVCGVKRKVV